MNTFTHARRTIFGLVLAALILAGGVFAFVSASSLKPAVGHTGQALALRAAGRPSPATLASLLSGPDFRQAHTKNWWPHLANGRLLQDKSVSPFLSGKHAHASRAMAAGINPQPIEIREGVQTFDVFAPPPTFVPPTGPLAPTNLQPIFTSNESYIFFASNRDGAGNVAADGRFHIWAVASNGGQVQQITSGVGNEFFPSLNTSNSVLAFISDNNTPAGMDRYDLYVVGGQSGVGMPAPLGSNATVDVRQLSRAVNPSLNSSKTEGATGFTTVGRPALSPTGDLIAFSAHTPPTATNPTPAITSDRDHIYFLNTATNGFDPNNAASPPAPLTNGNANDGNPAWSQDGNFIAFDSTSVGFTNTGQSLGPNSAPASSGNSPSAGPHGIFLLSVGGAAGFGTVPASLIGQPNGQPNGRVTVTGNDDVTPAWSFNVRNTYLNQSASQQYLTFSRGPAAGGNHGVFYFQAVYTDTTPTAVITPENDDATTGNPLFNTVIKLNTDDTDPANPAALVGNNLFDNTYPAWSPFQSIFNIVYQSPRSVTYNTPGTNVPTETAINISRSPSGPAADLSTVGPNYAGLLESQVINVDPPSMLRFSASEVIRVTDANDNPTRFIQPSAAGGGTPNTVKFIVRLSNREAGIDNVNGPNGGPNVYLQIKDPDSRYQDSQNLEHKLFANCNDVNLAAGGAALNSGTSLLLFNPGGPGITIVNNAFLPQVGAVGGYDYSANNDLSVGHIPTGGGGTGAAARSYPNYRRWGPEYECQFLNPTRANPNTAAGDYGAPFYLAGVDDTVPFSGLAHPPRPIVDNATTGAPAEYLQLQVLPAAQQDGLGGVLYGVTYQVPTAPSDFYLDVIAYDNAKFPYQTAAGTALPNPNRSYSSFQGLVKNWRIYDNTGGFTTVPFAGGNDILVVIDNALGQKFSFTTFGGGSTANLIPSLYGAESYYTDVDVDLLPNGIDYHKLDTGVPYTQLYSSFFTGAGASNQNAFGAQNGLGVNSYNDDQIDDGGRVDASNANLPNQATTVPFVRTQKYSLWRIISRGAIPTTVLAGYQPTFQTQPAVNDTVNNVVSPANPNVPVANRCVLWVSPYTGDLPLADAGSLDNPSTQQTLQGFVDAGGRLCITGQDVANALSLKNPASNNAFLTQTLGAAFKSDGGGSQILAPNAGRIAGFSGGPVRFNKLIDEFFLAFGASPPSSGHLLLGNAFGIDYRFLGEFTSDYRADASLDQTRHLSLALPNARAQIDTVTPSTFNDPQKQNPTTDILTNGQTGLFYYENYKTANAAFDGTRAAGFGSRIVFGSFGLEGLSQDTYRFSVKGVPFFAINNHRTKVLHNIVNYFRTGTFTGRITQANGAGVSGATVYVRPTGNIPNPRPLQLFSATTDFQGNYIIAGLEPATYSVTAYKDGFTTTTSNGTFGVEGDITINSINLVIAPQPPGRIKGIVTDATTGKPLVGATITFKSVNGQLIVGPTTSKLDGTYNIDNVPVGSYIGTATLDPRYSPQTIGTAASPVVVPSGGDAFIRVKPTDTTGPPPNFALFPKPATVTGTVFNDLDQSGLPRSPGEPGLAGAVVTFTSADGQTTFGPFTTDANGVYSASVTTPGTYTVVAKLATFEQRITITIALDFGDVKTQDIPLVFVPPGSIGGHVTNAVTGAPIAGAVVTFVSTDGAFTYTATTDANGNYIILNVPRGQYNGTASLQPTFTDAPAPVQGNPVSVPSGGSAPADFRLVPKGAIAGQVRDSVTNAPLAGATVTFVSTDGAITLGPVTTDATGSYAIPNVIPTTYNGTASLPPNYLDGTPVQNNPITVAPGASAAADFLLTAKPATVSGLTYLDANDNAQRDPTETPLAGATVVFTPTQFGAPATAVSDGVGVYNVSLVEGTYTVTATKAGFRDLHPFTLTVGPNQTRGGVDVPLIVPPGTLGGLITDAFSGQPLAGATVTITDAAGNPVTPLPNSGSLTTVGTSTTGPDGQPINYGPVRLLPGTYTVTVNPPKGYFQTARGGIVVTPDTFTRVDFNMTTGVQPLHIFPAGLNFFSVPYDYASAGVTPDLMFGQLNQGTFLTNPPVYNPPTANRSHLFVYRPELLQYVIDPTPPADGLHLGQGYWVYLRNGREVNFAVAPPAATVISVGLRRGWNMIGVPSATAISLSRLTFANPAGTGPITFDQASSTTYRIVSPTLYGYTGSASNPYFTVTSGAALQPWQAYWIFSFVDSTVQIPTTGG